MNTNAGLAGGINFVEKEATIRNEARGEEITDPVAEEGETGEMTRGKIIGGEDSNSGIIIKEGIGITMGEVGEGIMKGVGPQ
jgi:hypothetical protein